ncbi:hypothetical protein G7046_g6123 [Stylonectria norvegica]|nr:hypothetical protein G7046_g6123 [Stylonectria norvegica]
MKHSFALLAVAAGLGQVSATFGKFHSANSYSCPKNTDNKCDDKQKGGWTWGDLSPGKFDNYDGWNFNGWTCEDSFSKRDPLAKRTFDTKVISGSCSEGDKDNSPSFGCSSGTCGSGSDIDTFSLKQFDITTEFDCRMEFHYDMPDGSTCKHSSDCSSKGTTVYNTQCGGAKKVHFVYPSQDKPKKTCSVGVHKFHFDCDAPWS